MASGPFTTGSQWSWSADDDGTSHLNNRSHPERARNGAESSPASSHVPGSFQEEGPKSEPTSASAQDPDGPESRRPRTERHYGPRTCRICLEVVLPTFETPSEGFASFFDPTPSVSYISSDPKDGRLIRPCKCKGTGRYVHEGCLQAWRHADVSRARNYWECPSCKFRYRLERLTWSHMLSSTVTQLALTVFILLVTVFVLGFVADPIINLYLDPYETIASIPSGGTTEIHLDNSEGTWFEHLLKGIASLGLLGFVKAFFAMGPLQWWNLRQSGILAGGRARGTGRDRLENISWSLVVIGVITFLYTVWRFVRNWSRKTLEKASERVVDVQGEDDDFEEVPADAGTASEQKTQ